jgi:Tol biopolymer transport system component
VAVDIVDLQTNRDEVWIIDLLRHSSSRFTFGPSDNFCPIWSPDDNRIAFRSRSPRQQFAGIYQKESSGMGEEELLVSDDRVAAIPTDWSPDGRFLVYSALGADAAANWDIFAFSLTEKKRVAFLTTPADEYGGTFSPDGKWLAYVSEESGKAQVYVQRLSDAGGRWQISASGGDHPAWSRDGREVFYVAADNKLIAVEVRTSPGFEAGTPRVLFQTRMKNVGGRAPGRDYDVASDGRFVINTVAGEAQVAPITLVQNWAAELKK